MRAKAVIGFVVALQTFSLNALGLISNGDFEQPAISRDFPWFETYAAGQTLFGWLITQGSVDIVAPTHAAAGVSSQVLDLNGNEPGTIEQSIVTKPDVNYSLTWTFKRNTAGGAAPDGFRAAVLWNGQTRTTWSRAISDPATLGTMSIIVTGTGQDVLTFRSLAVGNSGFFLDDITLAQIPEPTSLLLFSLAAVPFILCMRRPNRYFSQQAELTRAQSRSQMSFEGNSRSTPAISTLRVDIPTLQWHAVFRSRPFPAFPISTTSMNLLKVKM